MLFVACLLGYLIVIVLLSLFLAKSERSLVLKVGFVVGIWHFVIVVLGAISIYASNSIYQESSSPVYFWFFFDFPSSLVLLLLRFIPGKVISYHGLLRDFYIPIGVFAILGSIQYFLIGAGVAWIFKKFSKDKNLK